MASVQDLYILEQVPARSDNDLLPTRPLTERVDKQDLAVCREALRQRHEGGVEKVLTRTAASLADFQHAFADRIDHQLLQSHHHRHYFDSVPGDAFLRQHRKQLAQKMEQVQQLIVRNKPDVPPEPPKTVPTDEQAPCAYKAVVQALYEEECDSVLLEKLKVIEEHEMAYMDDLMHIASDPTNPPPASTSAPRTTALRDPRLGHPSASLSFDPNKRR